MSLLDKVYLPDLEKRNIRNSEHYKLLKENKLDASIFRRLRKKKKLMKLLKYQLLMTRQIKISLQKIMQWLLHQVQKNI